MGTVINFKKATKKVAKIKKEKLAKEKRIKYGQKKLTQALIKRNKKSFKTHLDSHKLDATSDKSEG